jgi:hypothetical protein
MTLILYRLALLVLGHFIADYPLQGDFLSHGKNPNSPYPGFPWQWCMLAHTAIHAGAVYLVTGSLWLAAAELVIHWATDYLKCARLIGVNADQIIHLSCKVLYAVIG